MTTKDLGYPRWRCLAGVTQGPDWELNGRIRLPRYATPVPVIYATLSLWSFLMLNSQLPHKSKKFTLQILRYYIMTAWWHRQYMQCMETFLGYPDIGEHWLLTSALTGEKAIKFSKDQTLQSKRTESLSFQTKIVFSFCLFVISTLIFLS